MQNLKKNYTSFCTILSIIITFFLSGCAATTGPTADKLKVFFPPPPELPRVQFLKSFTGADDIEAKPSAFDQFVTGRKESGVQLLKPYGAAIHDGKIYVCDTNYSVMVFDLNANRYYRIHGARGLGKVVQPLNVSIDQDGTKYVTDPVRGQIIAYDKKDFFLKSYGKSKTWKPVDAVPYKNRLYVADANKEKPGIVVFDLESGARLKTIGQTGEPKERLGLPSNITIDKNGIIYITDAARFQIVKFDIDGHYIGEIGKVGQSLANFARPRGVAVNRDGKVFAVDAAFDNVQVFTPEGQLLMFFGGPGYSPGKLFLPADVSIDYDNVEYFREYADPNFEIEHLLIVVSQFGRRLVNVYGYGKDKGSKYPSDEELRRQLEKQIKEELEATGQEDSK